MRGGQDEETLVKALSKLRSVPTLAEMESLLAFFARFVLDTSFIQRLMRWDMTILRETPWYQEIVKEGIELGLTRGRRLEAEDRLLQVLEHRFGQKREDLRARVSHLRLEQLDDLFIVALDVPTWAEFEKHLAADTN